MCADGIELASDRIKAISDWPVPENLTELRAFVGLANYYRRHVEGFSDIEPGVDSNENRMIVQIRLIASILQFQISNNIGTVTKLMGSSLHKKKSSMQT